MKLHARNMLMLILCIFTLNGCCCCCCWWILGNHVDCCYCCCEEFPLMIRNMGDHNLWDLLRNGVFMWGLQKWVKWGFWIGNCFGSNFIWFWSSFNAWKCLGKFWKPNLGWRGSKLGFWDEKCEIRDSQLSVLATASKLAREASNMVTESHVCPPRRAKLLATASNGSQGAWFAHHGEQSHSLRRAWWWQETCLARHGE